MSGSKHCVSIRAFKPNTSVYFLANWGLDIFISFALSQDNPTVMLEPEIVTSYTDECISTSDVQDAYGNRQCYHTYHEMDAVFDLSSVPGIKYSEPRSNSSGRYIEITQDGHHLTDRFVLGDSDVSWYFYRYTKLTSNQSIMEEWRYGRHWATLTKTIVKIDYPRDLRRDWMLTVFTTYKYTDYALNHGMCTQWEYSDTHIEYHTPTCIGNAQMILSDAPTIKKLIDDSQSVNIREHFVPDDFTDQVFSKLTIPDVNNIENCKDLKNIRETLPPILKVLRKRSFRSLAEFYLWYKYTYSTTMLDLKAYYNFFKKWAEDSEKPSNVKRYKFHYAVQNQSNGVSSQEDTHYEIITDPYNVGVFRSLGLELNLSNTWDLIPFSFVVDWFVNIGTVLNRIDHTDVIAEINIHSVITSTKRTVVSQPLLALGCQSSCYGKYYYRTIDHVLPLGKLEFSFKNCGSHLLDGSALILANVRK